MAGRPDPSAEYARSQTPEGRANAKRLLKVSPKQKAKNVAAYKRVQKRIKDAKPPKSGPAPKRPAAPVRVDPEFAKFKAENAAFRATIKKGGNNPLRPGTTLAGFDPSRFQGAPGASFVGGFLQNLGRGAIRTITDAPAAAQLGVEAVLGGAAAGVNLATGNNSPTGVGNRGPVGIGKGVSRAIQDRSQRDLKAAGTGIKADYAHRWGPLLEGDVGKFGSRFYDDPFPTLVDAAGAYSIAGRAPAAVARGASVVARGRTAERLAEFGSKSRVAPGERNPVTGVVSEKGGKLHRPPRVIVSRAAETPDAPTNVAVVPRRPYSPNIMTRAGQRGADRLRERIGPRVEAAAQRVQPEPGQPSTAKARVLRPFTAQAKHERARRADTREIVFRREQVAENITNKEAAPFAQRVRALKPDKNAAGVRQKGLGTEHYATTMHLLDVVAPRAGMTARQLRDLVVQKMEKVAAKAEANGERTTMTRQNIEQIRNIPDELLDLNDLSNPAVKRVTAAVQAGRELDKITQERSVNANIIGADKVDEIAGRAAGLLLGGQEWGPAILKELKAQGATKAQIAAVKESATVKTPALAQAQERLAGAEATLSGAAEGGTATAIKAATRKRDKYLKQVKARSEVGFTPVARPEMVRGKGVYFPKKPVDKRNVPDAHSTPRRGMGGRPASKTDKGYLTQMGNFDMNPALLVSAHKRATAAEVGPISDAALEEFISIGAYTDKSGVAISGERAAQLARTDPTRVVLVHKGRLRDAMARLDDLTEEGQFLEPGEVKMIYGEGKEPWIQALPKGKISNQYIAVSKAAADVWRETPTQSVALRSFDTLLDYWKGGILALSPRWYVNSTIGVATQYGLMAGLDVKSIRQANRIGGIRDSIPPEVVINNLAHDVGSVTGINSNKLRKVFELGFRANNRMESGWRRGAYLNRAKRALKDEGVRVRDMSDAEIAYAIDHMPPSLARNIVRDVDLFLGEFRKFNTFERNVVKRVIPFYSWLRVISRLTLSLPFRSPVRMAALATLGRAGEYGILADDFQRPIYERGDIVLGDGVRIPTAGLNSFATLAGPAEAATKIIDNPADALGLLGEETVNWARPEIQTGLAATYGTNSFGGPVIASPNYGGTVRGFTGTRGINAASQLPESVRQRIPVDEALLQSFGGAPVQALRKGLSGGKRPYDDTRTLGLLNARLSGGSTKDMFLDESKTRYRKPLFNGLGSTVGINPVREDPKKLRDRYRKAMAEVRSILSETG